MPTLTFHLVFLALSANLAFQAPPADNEREVLLQSIRQLYIKDDTDPDLYELTATKLYKVDELTLRISSERKKKLEKTLGGHPFWLVQVITFQRDTHGIRKRVWTRQMLFDAKTRQQIHFAK